MNIDGNVVARIWKYPICSIDNGKPRITLLVRKPAELLTIQIQGSKYVAWFEVEMVGGGNDREVYLYGFETGEEIQNYSAMVYVTTTQINGYVLHWYWMKGVYEREKIHV